MDELEKERKLDKPELFVFACFIDADPVLIPNEIGLIVTRPGSSQHRGSSARPMLPTPFPLHLLS